MTSYSIRYQLGSGGSSTVYLANNPEGLFVAIKVQQRTKIPDFMWTLDHKGTLLPLEALVLCHIHHDNILKMLEYTQDNEQTYMVTELMLNSNGNPCSDLFDYTDRVVCLQEFEALRIFCQVMSAVMYLLKYNILHRDIKDENILVDDHLNIKLIDFGSASFFEPTQQVHFDRFQGTLQYAPPEVFSGQMYNGPQAESWTLGCLLYVMITGTVPFNDPKSVISTAFKQPDGISASCRDLLDQTLRKNPTDRLALSQITHHPWLE